MNIASSSKQAQNHAALVRASIGTAAAFVETQAIALRAKYAAAKPVVTSKAVEHAGTVALATKCGAAYAVSFLRTLAGK